jgi:hypothetical protein
VSTVVRVRPRSRYLKVAEVWTGGHRTHNGRVIAMNVRRWWGWHLRWRLVNISCSITSEIEWIAKIEIMTPSYAEDAWLRLGLWLLLQLLLWSCDCGRGLLSLRYWCSCRRIPENGDVALYWSEQAAGTRGSLGCLRLDSLRLLILLSHCI